ncbi:ParB/RepB/Spo0J family partition protein [Streptacidiphilus fuscans]|uniref:ParB-like nuclease domain-containing protein n=1 Tax=Streptacidiphilus fuscans TaxID=2789292 RepID=A0A931FHY8_9ACTN|nr:ParB/RepB/Spo0J family partition protein [Streptacidiphilus fuscans]MBF9072800.1 ParB-like nuclease domain-containing protein [Streptacidiphilus fuscans]
MSTEAAGAQTTAWSEGSLSDVHEIAVDRLHPADSPRRAGIDDRHVRLLAECETALPPIVVHAGTMRIIDGMHRWEAVVLRGETHIAARYFEGSELDAFAWAVKANTTHGLPLTAEDRSAATRRLLCSHPQWSDRAIAAVAGVSARTVRSLRQDADADVVSRMGRDGRSRPVSSAEGRLRAREMIEKDPQASLRTVARAAGVSPSTVRDVRERLRRGENVVPSGQQPKDDRRGAPLADGLSDRVPASAWDPTRDPSLRFSEQGRQLLRLLMMHRFPVQRREELLASVPPHATTAVSAAARECARAWDAFADLLAARTEEPAHSRG